MPIRPRRVIRSIALARARSPRLAWAGAVGLGALLLAGSGEALAQAAAGERLYQVEVVVFAQPGGGSLEQPPLPRPPAEDPLPGPFDPLATEEARQPEAGALSLDEASQIELPEGVSGPVLPQQLDAVARRLDSGGYRLLWHQSWVQPATERGGLSLSLPVLAALGGGRAQSGLSGSISLAAGRYLHFGVDLELASADGIEAILQAQRRLRVDEEHYLDHPRIGVVAIVTRLPASGKP